VSAASIFLSPPGCPLRGSFIVAYKISREIEGQGRGESPPGGAAIDRCTFLIVRDCCAVSSSFSSHRIWADDEDNHQLYSNDI